jgi:mannitol 2-dehydrogenase
VREPVFRDVLLDYMRLEAIPTLQQVPGIDLDVYCSDLIDRFGNEAVRDTLARLVVDGSDRIPKFLLPVLRRQLETGGEIRRCALVLAAWSRFLEGSDEQGNPTPINDRRQAELVAAVQAEQSQPGAFLDYHPVFGDLGGNAGLREAYATARSSIIEHGVRATIAGE